LPEAAEEQGEIHLVGRHCGEDVADQGRIVRLLFDQAELAAKPPLVA
jgi:hypothetical protein